MLLVQLGCSIELQSHILQNTCRVTGTTQNIVSWTPVVWPIYQRYLLRNLSIKTIVTHHTTPLHPNNCHKANTCRKIMSHVVNTDICHGKTKESVVSHAVLLPRPRQLPSDRSHADTFMACAFAGQKVGIYH